MEVKPSFLRAAVMVRLSQGPRLFFVLATGGLDLTVDETPKMSKATKRAFR
jgi:hypothetical protein